MKFTSEDNAKLVIEGWAHVTLESCLTLIEFMPCSDTRHEGCERNGKCKALDRHTCGEISLAIDAFRKCRKVRYTETVENVTKGE